MYLLKEDHQRLLLRVLRITEPTVLRLDLKPSDLKTVRDLLIYEDKSVSYLLNKTHNSLKRHLRNPDLEKKMGKWKYNQFIEFYTKKIEKLEKQKICSLLFEDHDGFWTYSGLSDLISNKLSLQKPEVSYDLPDPDLIPYKKTFPYPDRYYQTEAFNALLENAKYGPCAIELATGSGKSVCIYNITKHFSLKTLVISPSVSIAYQLFDLFTDLLGSKYVGFYGDGKKQANKLITIAIDDSVINIKEGSKEWKGISDCKVLIIDESHLVAAATQHKIATGIAKSAPYRFFVTATHMRNDGKDLLLLGLTGPVVYRKTLKELVDEGYLSKPLFRVASIDTDSSDPKDANEATRVNLYYNPEVNQKAAELANYFVEELKRPTLIRIDEIEQFSYLFKHLKGRIGFAHGTLNKSNINTVPEQFRNLDPKSEVDKFNQGLLDILVGTSCISTGTDIQVAEAGIYLVGGMSEIEVMQSLGRCTRGGSKSFVKNPWTGKQKTDAIWVDFMVNTPTLIRHAKVRLEIYNQTYGPVKIIGNR